MSEREWGFYLDDMIGFAEKAIAYTNGLDQDGFATSGLNYDATVHNLELLGETPPRIFHPRSAMRTLKSLGGS